MTRPFDQLTRIRPPTFTSRIMRMNVRYWREREFGAAPWKLMKMSCATSSRKVMFFIQCFTAADAFTGGVFRDADRLPDLAEVLAAGAGLDGALVAPKASTMAAAINRE